MPEELKPLSCPVCGHHAEVYGQKELKNRSYVSCADTECSVCGPFADSINEAIEKWNALPRKLKWTKETPIKPGIYWARINDKEPVIIYVDVLPEGPLAGQMVCYIAGMTEDVLLEDINKETEWAGPIPEPIEE